MNGFFTKFFQVQRSLRHGCPSSALLYVLCIEPLAIKIREDESIKGIRMPGCTEPAKICLFADDTNTFVSEISSVSRIIEWFNTDWKASGAKLNRVKSKGLWLGKWTGRVDSPFNLVWCTVLKINGIYSGKNTQARNYTALTDKLLKSITRTV